jgi:hypothetical protein
MINALFLVGLSVLLLASLIWGIKTLPSERWQMIAAVPVAKTSDGLWQSVNLTFYGFFSATANIFGITLMIVLLSSVSTPVTAAAVLIFVMMLICVPSSKIVAAVVEGKSNTFTIAGAAFVAALVLPPEVWALQRYCAPGSTFPLMFCHRWRQPRSVTHYRSQLAGWLA